jgi:1,4-dihydroxy-2-naphthoate octaprenyltransferase
VVFFLMGVLMVVASYFAQTCELTWKPVVASLPVSCLVAAILHGNDLRDTLTDRKADILTTTLIVGLRPARALFYALHITPYLVTGAGVAAGVLPAWSLVTLLALPLTVGAVKTWRRAASGPTTPRASASSRECRRARISYSARFW